MGDTHKHLARLGVSHSDEGLVFLPEGLVARFVALYDFAGLLVDDEKVVVLVEDPFLEVGIFLRGEFPVDHS